MNLFNEKEWNEYRAAHPELRFFQALCNYLYVEKVLVKYGDDEEVVYEDTFYWNDDK